MKKSIITLSLIVISICGFSQKIGIKLASTQTLVATPAVTAPTDSVAVQNIIDNGSSVQVDLRYYKSGSSPCGRALILWEGQAYKDNESWTNTMVIDRIKVLLGIH
jgi:hypothetical protein